MQAHKRGQAALRLLCLERGKKVARKQSMLGWRAQQAPAGELRTWHALWRTRWNMQTVQRRKGLQGARAGLSGT